MQHWVASLATQIRPGQKCPLCPRICQLSRSPGSVPWWLGTVAPTSEGCDPEWLCSYKPPAHVTSKGTGHPWALPLEATEGQHLKWPSQTSLHPLGCDQYTSGRADKFWNKKKHGSTWLDDEILTVWKSIVRIQLIQRWNIPLIINQCIFNMNI